MPIVQIASTALRHANDALLGVHCITRITTPPTPPLFTSFGLRAGFRN